MNELARLKKVSDALQRSSALFHRGMDDIKAVATAYDARQIERRTLERRAIEAAIWGMPLVNFDAMRQAYFRDARAKYNDVLYWSKSSDWKNQSTTPDHSANYILFFVNLKDGPVVINIPPADDVSLYGAFVDSWTIPLINVGSTGEDKGKGAKYLLLPPRYRGDAPIGHILVPCSTYNCYGLLRIITPTHHEADMAKATAYLQRLKIYPLLSEYPPKPNRFIDMAGKAFEAVPSFDETFYDSLARMVAEEPVQERDMSIMGQLRTLDIGKSIIFRPDAQRNVHLRHAAQQAHAYLTEGFATSGDLFWPDKRRWRTPAPIQLVDSTKASFIEPGKGVQIDQRGFAWFAMFGPCVPPASQVYMKTFEAESGERLNGSHYYHLNVPAAVPANQFWAIDVYDATTGTFFREVQRVGLDSYDHALRPNADGSTDIYFAPNPPTDRQSNWIPTIPGKPFFVMFRLYGPQRAFAEGAWILNDIEHMQ